MVLVLLAILYGIADRLWGSDVKHARRYVCLGLPLLAYLLDGGMVGLATAVGFIAVRSLGFKMFGGSSTPETSRETIGLFARYAVMVPVGLGIAVTAGNDPLRAVIAYGVWAAVATAMGVHYGKENREAKENGQPIDPQINVAIEALRGAAFGLLAGLV